MNVLLALSKAIRSTLVLAVVAVLAFGSLAAPVAAAQHDPAEYVFDETTSHDHGATVAAASEATKCLSGHDMGKHAEDGACCAGICVSYVSAATGPLSPVLTLSEIEPFHAPLLVRSGVVEFLRPPSLTI